MRRHIATPGKISTFRFILLLRRFCLSKIRGRPYVLNIEVTQRCNAQCGHCVCWKIDPVPEISDYSDIASRFHPVIIWLTGGEPLLRPDIGQVIKKIRMVDPFVYLGMSTNGWLLNQKLARVLAEKGLNQINISLDFLGSAHDQHRKINNLWAHIDEMLPTLKSLRLRVVLTTSIMRENIDCLLPIARLAFSKGVGVGYSCYSAMKTRDYGHCIRNEQLEKLNQIIADLCRMKKKLGFVESSSSYLKRVPEFFEKGRLGRCLATKSWLCILPDGHLKICPDKEIYVHYSSYAGPIPVACRECWYTCRGEMETPFLERLWEAWQKWMALRRSSGSFSSRS